MGDVKIKWQRTVFDIVGIIFLIVGSPFVMIGAVVGFRLGNFSRLPEEDIRFLPIIFIGLGLLFAVLGAAFLIAAGRRRAQTKRLVKNGFYVMAKVRDIYCNENVRINGRCPFVLECHYLDTATGKTHIFRSGDLMFYPIDAKDTDIRVFVDPADMDHYYVDTSRLTDSVVYH